MKPAGITTSGCRPPLLSACVPRHYPCSPANNALFSGLSPLSRLKARTFSFTIRATGDTNQGNSDGLHHIKTLRSAYVSTVAKAILNFTSSNFLPIALISAVALGIANPTPGCLAHKLSLSKFSTSGIFFISGLKLRGREFRAVAEAWPAGIFGLASILLLSPFFSRLILQVPLAPHDFVTGLAIFSCMPTTLSSGVALTQLAGGNSSLALAMTVVSNLLGIVTVPLWISQFWVDGYGVTIPTRELFWSLIFTLLLPLALGKATAGLDEWFNFIIFIMFVDLTHIAGILNPFPLTGLATYIDQNQRISTMTSVILLSLTPWMQVSKSRPLLITFKPQVFFEAIGMGIAVHLTLLVFNTIAVKCMSAASGETKSIFARKENLRALLIVCSQKALLTVVAVVEQLSGALGESGLLVLPCVAAHINQVIIDSLLVNFWLRKDQSEDKNFEA